MKQGSSFAKKQGTMIALACAAAFAAPHAMAQVASPDYSSGKGLTLAVDFLLGLYSKNISGATIGPAGDTVRRTELASSSSSVYLTGSEKLNGDFLQGWGFQITWDYDPDEYNRRGTTETSQTTIGVGTSIGNIFFGVYDNPYKQVGASFATGASSNGNGMSAGAHLGIPGFRVGTAKGARCGDAESQGGTITAAAPCGTNTASTTASMGFYRLNSNSLNYYSPVMNGFKVYAQYVPGDTDVPSGTDVSTAPNVLFRLPSPQLISLAGTYNNGPLALGLIYETHRDYLWGAPFAGGAQFGAGTSATGIGDRSSDTAKLVGAAYTFGNIKLAGYWQRLEYNQSGGSIGATSLTDLSVDSWYLSTAVKIGGPHTVNAFMSQADDYKCNSGFATGAISPCTRGETGMKFYGISYVNQVSKQMRFFVSATRVDNDRYAMYSGSSTATKNGTNFAGAALTNIGIGMKGSF